MERRFLNIANCVRLERRGTDPPTVTGYAAVFWVPDDPGTEYPLYEDVVERIAPGCFDRAVQEDDVRALFNHDPNCVLGRTTSGTLTLTVDGKGLRYTITPPNAPLTQGVIESIRRGDVTGSSFSFVVRKQNVVRQKGGPVVRELLDVQLFDCGPVTFPAYGSTTAAARALEDEAELRDALLAAAVPETKKQRKLRRVLERGRVLAWRPELARMRLALAEAEGRG